MSRMALYTLYGIRKRKVTVTVSIPEKANTRWKMRQFPIMAGSAITAHKAQGKTMEKVAIEKKYRSEKGGYVAITRVRKKEEMVVMRRRDTRR